jgi:hypothetical protein
VVRFVPDDEVRWFEVINAAAEGVDTTDGNSVLIIESTSGGNEAMGHSCEGEGGGCLGEEEIAMHDHPRSPAFLSRSCNHKGRERGLA